MPIGFRAAACRTPGAATRVFDGCSGDWPRRPQERRRRAAGPAFVRQRGEAATIRLRLRDGDAGAGNGGGKRRHDAAMTAWRAPVGAYRRRNMPVGGSGQGNGSRVVFTVVARNEAGCVGDIDPDTRNRQHDDQYARYSAHLRPLVPARIMRPHDITGVDLGQAAGACGKGRTRRAMQADPSEREGGAISFLSESFILRLGTFNPA